MKIYHPYPHEIEINVPGFVIQFPDDEEPWWWIENLSELQEFLAGVVDIYMSDGKIYISL